MTGSLRSGRLALFAWYVAAFLAGASSRLFLARTGAAHIDGITTAALIRPLPDTLSLEHLDALIDTMLTYDPMDARVHTPVISELPPPPAEPVRPSTPALVLRGVVGGPPWIALLDGAPGQPGAVLLGQGDTLGMLRVLRVTADAVTLRDADSTWTLQLAATWR